MTSWSSYKNLYKAHGFKRVWTHFRETTLFDILNGVDTETWRPLSEYTETDSDMKHYQASFTQEIIKCFNLLRSIAQTDKFTFYDVGCGKGKVLIMAAKYLPCQGIVGIELDENLAAIASKNLQKLGIGAEIIKENARVFNNYAEHSIIYICDPFGVETLTQMLTHITNASKACYLVYNNPVYESDVELAGFKKVGETTGWHNNYHTGIYLYQK